MLVSIGLQAIESLEVEHVRFTLVLNAFESWGDRTCFSTIIEKDF